MHKDATRRERSCTVTEKGTRGDRGWVGKTSGQHAFPLALNIKPSSVLSSPASHLTMATAVTTHTSAFSFTAPFPSSSGPKQRRVSLATPASEREVPAFKFRDDTSLPSPSEERRGKVRRLASPVPQEKKARKKWTMEETQMLVEGCNRVSALSSSYCGVTRAHPPLPFPL
jgi:hypothetical protein